MAHQLAGDVQKFASLDHLDPGAPKTTDLDEAIQADEEAGKLQAPADAAGRGRAPSFADTSSLEESTSRMDKEDVITVKYLPMKLAPAEQIDASQERQEPDDQIDPMDGVSFVHRRAPKLLA